MNIWRPLVAFACLALAGCATPNVKPFAEQTDALTNAVLEEQKMVAGQFDALLGLIEKGRNTVPPMTSIDKAKWAARKKSYMMSMSVVTQVLAEAKTYSEQVAKLAADGESGGEAAKKIYKTVQGFSSIAATAGGPLVSLPAELAGSVAGRIFMEIGQAWTRYEAQKGLKAATEEAQPAIDKIAAGLNQIYGDIQKKLLFGLQIATGRAQGEVLNTSSVKFHRNYRNNARLIDLVEGKLDLDAVKVGHCLGSKKSTNARLNCLGNNARAANAVRTSDAAALQALTTESEAARHNIEAVYLLFSALEDTKADYDKFLNARSELKTWHATRKARAKAIVIAVKKWAATHKELSEALAKCGGLKALKSSCGNLTVENLKGAIKRIKFVIGDNP